MAVDRELVHRDQAHIDHRPVRMRGKAERQARRGRPFERGGRHNLGRILRKRAGLADLERLQQPAEKVGTEHESLIRRDQRLRRRVGGRVTASDPFRPQMASPPCGRPEKLRLQSRSKPPEAPRP